MPTPWEVIKEGTGKISQAIAAAKICDLEKAHRLQSLALASMIKAFRMSHKDPSFKDAAKSRKFFAAMEPLVDGLRRFPGHVAECEKKAKKAAWKPAGTFHNKGTKGLLAGSSPKNKITFEFKVDKDDKCEKYCVVQVYHIEDAKTGETVIPPSKADKRGSGFSLGQSPRDQDAQDGYVVDANPLTANSSGVMILSKDPCYPSKQSGRTITAEDQPEFLKTGYVAYFETCVVCMDGKKPRILGCMRWVHRPDPGRSRVQRNDQKKKDWGAPSPPFRAALGKWLLNHK